MKTKIIYALVGLTSMFVIAKVDAATVFTPTDGDVNFLFGDLQGGILAIFDDSDQSYSGASLNVDIPGITGIVGPFGGGDYIASNTNGTLILTGSNHFILGLNIDGTWSADASVTAVGANSYTVSFDNGGTVVQVDVDIVPAVPLPAAAWLFGSGLLGLVGGGAMIRRKARVS